MRLRFNKDAINNIINSEYNIDSFPFTLPKNSILEIGMGKGKMITDMAFSNPNNFYIGLEKYATVAEKAIKKANELKLNNFKMIIGDAKNLREYVNGKFDNIWITFSDPWPKKRHIKRRLLYRDFLNIYKDILSQNGNIYFKSDNDGLYEFALEEMYELKLNIVHTCTDLHNCDYFKNNYLTEYEQKFKDLNKNINFIIFNYKKSN